MIAMKKHFARKRSLRRALLVLVAPTLALAPFVAYANDKTLSMIGQKLGIIIGWFIQLLFIKPLAKILSVLLTLLIEMAQFNIFVRSGAVELGWVMVRDVSNLFFVVILLVIAFATILHIEAYNYKRLLPKLLIMAILINFSKTIAGVVVDFSQVIMNFFVDAFSGVGYGTFISGLGLTEFLKLDSLDSIESDTGKKVAAEAITLFNVISGYILAAVMLAITTTVVLIFLIVIVIRVVAFWILIILSPLAFLCAILPTTQKYWTRWWTEMGKYAIVGPAVAFFLWLGLAIMASGDANIGDTLTKAGVGVSSASGVMGVFNMTLISKYVVVICFLLAGLKVTKELGIAGQGLIDKVSSGSRKFLTGWGKRAMKYSAAFGTAGLAPLAAAGVVKHGEKAAIKTMGFLSRTPVFGKEMDKPLMSLLESKEKRKSTAKGKAALLEKYPEVASGIYGTKAQLRKPSTWLKRGTVPFDFEHQALQGAMKDAMPATIFKDDPGGRLKAARGASDEDIRGWKGRQQISMASMLRDDGHDTEAEKIMRIHLQQKKGGKYGQDRFQYDKQRGYEQRNAAGAWVPTPSGTYNESLDAGETLVSGPNAPKDVTMEGGRIVPTTDYMHAGRESDPQAPAFQAMLTHMVGAYEEESEKSFDADGGKDFIRYAKDKKNWDRNIGAMGMRVGQEEMLSQEDFLTRAGQFSDMEQAKTFMSEPMQEPPPPPPPPTEQGAQRRGNTRLYGVGSPNASDSRDNGYMRLSFRGLNEHLNQENQLRENETSANIRPEHKQVFATAAADMLAQQRGGLEAAETDNEIKAQISQFGRRPMPEDTEDNRDKLRKTVSSRHKINEKELQGLSVAQLQKRRVVEELGTAEKNLRDPEWVKKNSLSLNNSDLTSSISVNEQKRHEKGHNAVNKLEADGADLAKMFAGIPEDIKKELSAQLQAEGRHGEDEGTNKREMLSDYMGGRYAAARPDTQKMKRLRKTRELKDRQLAKMGKGQARDTIQKQRDSVDEELKNEQKRTRAPKPHEKTAEEFSAQPPQGGQADDAAVARLISVQGGDTTINQNIHSNVEVQSALKGLKSGLSQGPWTPVQSLFVIKTLKKALLQLSKIQSSEVRDEASTKHLQDLVGNLEAARSSGGDNITPAEITLIEQAEGLVSPSQGEDSSTEERT